MAKKIIYIVLGIVIIIGTILIIYYFKDKNVVKNQIISKPAIKLLNEKLFSPKLINNKLYFIKSNQQNISYLALEDNKIYDVISFPEKIKYIYWGNLENDFIAQTQKSENDYYKNWYYNKIKKQIQQISPGITLASWSADDNQMFYDYYKSNGDYDPNTIHALYSANPNGSFYKKLIDLKMDVPNNILASPNGILIIAGNSGYETNDLLFYNLQNQKLTNITNKSFVNNGKWSPKYKYIIYNTLSPDTNEVKLFIIDANGDNKKDFNLSTETNKSIINNDETILYAAIPQGNNSLNDNLYRINIKTGKKTLLFQSTEKEHYSFDNLMLSTDNKILFFTADDYLYKIDI